MNIEGMSRQEILNTVVNAMIEQDRPSMEKGQACSYRSENGAKCSVGVLMDDNQYSVLFEGRRAGDLLENEDELPEDALEFAKVIRRDHEFFNDLQDAHDDSGRESAKYDRDTGKFMGYDIRKFRRGFFNRIASLCERFHLRRPDGLNDWATQ